MEKCPNCESTEWEDISKETKLPLVKCKDCGEEFYVFKNKKQADKFIGELMLKRLGIK